VLNDQPLETLTADQFRLAFREKEVDLMLRSSSQGTVRAVHLQAAAYPLTALPQGRQLAQKIGYVELPAIATGTLDHQHAYAQAGQQVIREIDQEETQGWIIDLRRNFGGTIPPMLIGVGSILGEGVCYSYVAPDWKASVVYRHGQLSTERWGVLKTEVKDPYELKKPWPPVAVLTSYVTASAGEFVVLAFRGRPRTRSFGEATRGAPTGNEGKVMSDGAAITLTTVLGGDRTGQAYDSPLIPDQLVQTDWGRLGTDDDPVLQMALQWLQAEMGSL
jgi:C-terminal processing protease CtpA/Prc